MAKKKVVQVSDKMWDKVSMENKLYVEEYLDSLTTVSDNTFTRYRLDLRQFMYWMYSGLNNKPLHQIDKNDFERYINVLRTNGASANSVYTKRNSLLAFLNFIYEKIKPNNEKFKDFPNDFNQVAKQKNVISKTKHPVTFKEYQLLVDEFTRQNYLIGVAWVTFVFYTGANFNDFRWLKSDILKHPFPSNADYVLSNSIKSGNPNSNRKDFITYKINREVYDALKKYYDSNDFEAEYIFSKSVKDKIEQIAGTWAPNFCRLKASEVLGRAVTATDFMKSYKLYKNKEKSLRNTWDKEMISGLLNLERTTSPLDFTKDEKEILKILQD